ncbi:MAG TPA: hypothetical protein VKZ83_15585 [Phototrophicaceae bacterium]|nr:hypothetical protein [Phototrophicaceae bacterium]
MTNPGAATAVWHGTVPDIPVRQQGPAAVVLRLAIVVGLVAGWAQLAQMPASASLDELFSDLQRGVVTRITLDRPAPDSATSGELPVQWEGSWRPGRASYSYESEYVGSRVTVQVDEAARIRAAAERSPAPVEIVEVTGGLYESGTTWFLHGIAWFGALLVLVGGPQPRLATKWAWFWLMYLVPPTALALVALEPVPLWRGEARWRARRLTGGWALLIGLVGAGVLSETAFGTLFR